MPRPVARYRPGQAPAVAASDSSSDDEGAASAPRAVQPRPKLPSRVTQAAASAAGVTIQRGDEAICPQPKAHAPAPRKAEIDLSEYGASP